MCLIACQYISLFGVGESDLVLGLDWFTPYHDARLKGPSESKSTH